MDELKDERAMVGRARNALTRLVGLEKGDHMADKLWEARLAKYPPPSSKELSQ